MNSTTYTQILTRGNKANLPSVSDGKIRFTPDSQQLFIDYGQSRIEITDVVKSYTAQQILALQSPLDKIYLSSDTHQLYYYDATNTQWINLFANHTHTASQITDLTSIDFITVDNIDSTDGLDFGDEDDEDEEEE